MCCKPVGTSWERGKEAGLRLMKEIKEEYSNLDLSFIVRSPNSK